VTPNQLSGDSRGASRGTGCGAAPPFLNGAAAAPSGTARHRESLPLDERRNTAYEPVGSPQGSPEWQM
jgi:hypothetical protein